MRITTTAATFALLIFSFTACETGYQKTDSGLQYKIYRTGHGPVATAGSTVKLHYTQLVHDTVTNTTRGKMPYYKALIPGTIFPYDPFEVLAKDVREGDSIIVMQRMDSLLKKGKLNKLPSHLSPGDVLVVRMKVMKVFPFNIMKPGYSDSLIQVDKQAERAYVDSMQTILGPKRVEQFLAERKFAATADAHGAYLQVLQPGSGPQADSGKWVQVKFKVLTLQGKVLDTNMDTTFHHTDPLRFQVGSGYMPASVDRNIRRLKEGSHARIFIPAMVAMRDMPSPSEQPTYDDMVFEIKLEDVRDKK